MAIKVSGTVVVDNDRNFNVGIVTATSVDVPPQAISFSPADGASDVALNSNIVITFNTNVEKSTGGGITLREGSASGTLIGSIPVSGSNVTISGGQVTINPADFPTGKDIYVVVAEGAFESSSLGSASALIDTYNFSTGPITTSSFSPSDGATDQSVSTNIVITFSENITVGSGNITLRAGSASGTVRQTIDVTTGAVSVSGTQATINPPSDLEYEEDTYVVVDAGCFRNSDGDVASGNAIINTYNFTTESAWPSLGAQGEGGYLICMASNNYWIVSPISAEVVRTWYSRDDASYRAQQVSGCTGWFVPTCAQLQNPGYVCRTYWDSYSAVHYWSDTEDTSCGAWMTSLNHGGTANMFKTKACCVRAFRCVSY